MNVARCICADYKGPFDVNPRCPLHGPHRSERDHADVGETAATHPFRIARPYRERLLSSYCAVHLGSPCEIGIRFADKTVDETAQWLHELADNMTHAQPADVARFLHGLAREIKR